MLKPNNGTNIKSGVNSSEFSSGSKIFAIFYIIFVSGVHFLNIKGSFFALITGKQTVYPKLTKISRMGRMLNSVLIGQYPDIIFTLFPLMIFFNSGIIIFKNGTCHQLERNEAIVT